MIYLAPIMLTLGIVSSYCYNCPDGKECDIDIEYTSNYITAEKLKNQIPSYERDWRERYAS